MLGTHLGTFAGVGLVVLGTLAGVVTASDASLRLPAPLEGTGTPFQLSGMGLGDAIRPREVGGVPTVRTQP